MSVATEKMSRKDRWLFGVSWSAICGVIGWLAWSRPDGLWVAAGATGTAWLVAMLFDRDDSPADRAVGLIVPTTLLIAPVLRWASAPQWISPVLWWTLGLWGLTAAMAGEGPGNAFADGARRVGKAVGWSFSRCFLGVAYFGVITPIGLAMRSMGRDTMARRRDPAAKTYWQGHEPPENSNRYFRQF